MTDKEAKSNLNILKKTLLDPCKFRDSEHRNKACYSQGWKKYGYVETWDVALNLLSNLPANENVFNELILETNKVKPYLDVEWIKEDFPSYNPEMVKMKLKRSLVHIFRTDFDYKLDQRDIYFAKCHRPKNEGYKYSFHVIVSTHNPTVVFENANKASYLANRIQDIIGKYINDKYDIEETEPEEYQEYKFDAKIIDTGVYKKTQNIRLTGHCKSGEFAFPMTIEEDSPQIEYIITNIDRYFFVLPVDEQADSLHLETENMDSQNLETEDRQFILEKVKEYHPTAYFEKIDSRGFIQFNYRDRKEKCFTDDNKVVLHDHIGFYAYTYNGQIILGCHSGNCVKNKDKTDITKVGKKTIIVGALPVHTNLSFEKVDFENDFPEIERDGPFIKKCIQNGALGLSNLFERMYLSPKRIKWINDTKMGSSYFWDGKLWQEDDYSYIERLLVSTCVKVIRNYKYNYTQNSEIQNEKDDEIVSIANKIVTKLNDGMCISNILKFVKPMIRDTEFSKIKDIHPYLLSCKNGMVDLVTGILRPSVPEDNITRSLETKYNTNADTTVFDTFVRQITSNEKGYNEELYQFFRWCIGYSIQGSPKKKLFIILYGPHGFNGKSLVMNTIKEVLENYAVAMDSSVVLDNGTKKTGGSHSTELMQLENGRLGLLSDTKEDANIDDGKVKQLTGITDKISAREIFGKQKEFTPTFVPFISTNHPIQVNLSDKAMYERLILFPFVLSFVDHPKEKYERPNNPSLAEIFKTEKEGILKWIIDCGVFYNKNQNMDQPKDILEAKDKYNKQVNIYVDFIDTTFTITDNETDLVSRRDLLDAYKVYMQQNGMLSKCKPKAAEREFNKTLQTKQYKGSTFYFGIKFKEEYQENDDPLN